MSSENDVPLGEGSRRYYEQQFGDRIRQVKKGGGRAPSDGGDGSKWQRGAGCGGLLAVFFIIRIVMVLVGSQSNAPSYNYTPTPPDFDVGMKQDLNDLFNQPNAPIFPPVVLEDEKALLTDEDVPLLAGLSYRIYQESLRPEAAPGGYLMKLLEPDARTLVVKSARGQALDGNERTELLDGLNEILQQADVWEPAAFRKVPAVQEFLRVHQEVFRGEKLLHRALDRRMVLELCYPQQIVPMDERNKLDGPARELWRKRARLDLDQARREYEPGKR
jgi:hypothetical protein